MTEEFAVTMTQYGAVCTLLKWAGKDVERQANRIEELDGIIADLRKELDETQQKLAEMKKLKIDEVYKVLADLRAEFNHQFGGSPPL